MLKIIKDIKNVALEGKEKDFLKSYIVRQALLWTIDKNPSIATEEEILTQSLYTIIQFYHEGHFPSFLEPRRNLIFKLSKTKLCKVAENKVTNILAHLEEYMDKIKDVQAKTREDITEVRCHLSPLATFLQFPAVSESMADKIMAEFPWPLPTGEDREDLRKAFRACLATFIDYSTNH